MNHYVPNLSELQLLGELNYRRLGKLVRGHEEDDTWHFAVNTSGEHQTRLSLYLIGESRFTADVKLEFYSETKAILPFDTKLVMNIRLYHDAGIAEITDGHRHYMGVYPYPNEDMLHRDEKFRLNQQLADLLELCLKHGHRLYDVPDFQFAY
ncbi:DUF1249 domain-containing protein [Maribrevibacterium harenarium]|uniref:DUF1249 domain-containing protein n=1 Tax=Maribrevibacterium harenarium TaxID=2589817 RepID=A0A501X328_9GAMM|nr:DUF1249 domain-containing protein [Maribrevibacterium harenarium]TPE54898.1 DUF1249 domain-containing protein [Maribrevibacterium harenarium]